MGHMNLFPSSKLPVPSGYLLHSHGKNHHAIKNGKPPISMGHLYHGYVSHSQRVTLCYGNGMAQRDR